MMDYKELETFTSYLIDKVEECYQDEMITFTNGYLKDYKRNGKEKYNSTDLSIFFTVVKDKVDEVYIDEVNRAIKELVNELKITQTITNARANM